MAMRCGPRCVQRAAGHSDPMPMVSGPRATDGASSYVDALDDFAGLMCRVMKRAVAAGATVCAARCFSADTAAEAQRRQTFEMKQLECRYNTLCRLHNEALHPGPRHGQDRGRDREGGPGGPGGIRGSQDDTPCVAERRRRRRKRWPGCRRRMSHVAAPRAGTITVSAQMPSPMPKSAMRSFGQHGAAMPPSVSKSSPPRSTESSNSNSSVGHSSGDGAPRSRMRLAYTPPTPPNTRTSKEQQAATDQRAVHVPAATLRGRATFAMLDGDGGGAAESFGGGGAGGRPSVATGVAASSASAVSGASLSNADTAQMLQLAHGLSQRMASLEARRCHQRQLQQSNSCSTPRPCSCSSDSTNSSSSIGSSGNNYSMCRLPRHRHTRIAARPPRAAPRSRLRPVWMAGCCEPPMSVRQL